MQTNCFVFALCDYYRLVFILAVMGTNEKKKIELNLNTNRIIAIELKLFANGIYNISAYIVDQPYLI